jgi:hypothetical protein
MTTRLQALRDLEARAIGAPWVADMLTEAAERCIDSFADPNFRRAVAKVRAISGPYQRDADAELIVALRNALPDLIRLIEAAADCEPECEEIEGPSCGKCLGCRLRAALQPFVGGE